jgi:hypothetical protein
VFQLTQANQAVGSLFGFFHSFFIIDPFCLLDQVNYLIINNILFEHSFAWTAIRHEIAGIDETWVAEEQNNMIDSCKSYKHNSAKENFSVCSELFNIW